MNDPLQICLSLFFDPFFVLCQLREADDCATLLLEPICRLQSVQPEKNTQDLGNRRQSIQDDVDVDLSRQLV